MNLAPAARGIDAVKVAIDEFVDYVKRNETGTTMYASWQQVDDPTRFVHLFEFEDQAAQDAHGRSDAVRSFEAVYPVIPRPRPRRVHQLP
jgi:quinol monooxygenase YgiN